MRFKSAFPHLAMAASLALLAGCNKAAEQASNAGDEAKGPNVGVSAVPGLSLSYQYGFRMPVEKITGAQEDNAAQCEALGVTQCIITGMSYDVGRDRTVSASLQLRLAPEIARKFGKQAVDAVSKHGGMLAHSQINSEDSGAVIAGAKADNASVDAERARIEKQLAQPGLGSAERQGLQNQLAALSEATRANTTTQRDAARKLANTPMTLNYETGAVDQSLSDGPIIGAFKDGWVNVVSGIAAIITILITLLPWALCGALAVYLWRRFARGLFKQKDRPREG